MKAAIYPYLPPTPKEEKLIIQPVLRVGKQAASHEGVNDATTAVDDVIAPRYWDVIGDVIICVKLVFENFE